MAQKTKAQYEAEKKARAEAKQAEAARKESEELKAKTRKPADIQKIYDSLIVQVGDKQFQGEVIKAEVLQLNQQLFELSKEYRIAVAVHGESPKADKAQEILDSKKTDSEKTVTQ